MKIRDFLKHNSLFVIMFNFTIISIFFVSFIIIWTTIRMSEDFFIDKFSITNTKVINRVKGDFESFHSSIVTATNELLKSGNLKTILTSEQTNKERMTAYYNLNLLMERVKSTVDGYDVSINVIGKNGISYSTDRTYWPISDAELKNSRISSNTLDEPKKLMYQYDKRTRLNTNRIGGAYIVASKAFMERLSGKIYGTMYIAIQENEFAKFYSNFTSKGNDIVLIDGNGFIVSSNRKELIGKKDKELLSHAETLKNNTNHYVTEDFLGKEHIFFSEYLPSYEMYILNMIDKHTAIQGLVDKRELAQTLLIIFFVVLIVVFFGSKKLTNSLSRLVKEIANVSKTNFHQSISVQGTYETRKISIAFNSMLEELQDYVEKLISIQKQKRNAELAALQQQINPHFLYNTLTSIKFMVQQGSKEEAEETTTALISLLQNTVGQVNETITVKQEVENLKNYVFINQKRYGTRIHVNYFIASDCQDCLIPKLILQPFIENAFFHGFNRKQNGYIHVLIWRDHATLICEVVDNGDGMSLSKGESDLPNTNRRQERFTGIGIRNVHERIQLIYGEEYGVSIESELDEGTKIKISLPFENDSN
ncbi:sensor histidine kinase [Metabacillus niabensis]|uniref:sensor histidine kinase n=1 Tax=Metabacillus niabensis TaxID=324854 RepID=UPI0039A14C0A